MIYFSQLAIRRFVHLFRLTFSVTFPMIACLNSKSQNASYYFYKNLTFL